MKIAFFWCCLIILCIYRTPAIASPTKASVACVQTALNALGQDVGSVDGVMGRMTRHASEAIREADQYADLPRLKTENAIVWCRVLGERDAAIRALWPAADSQFLFEFGSDVPAVIQKRVVWMAQNEYQRISDRLSVDLAGQITVLASGSSSQLTNMIYKFLGATRGKNEIRGDISRYCQGRRNLGGMAYRGLIVFCGKLLSEAKPSLVELDYWGGRIISHEIVHEFQYQLAGYSWVGTFSWKLGVGPKWIREGTASALELTVAHSSDTSEETPWFIEKGQNDLSKLGGKVSDAGWDNNGVQISAYAGLRLLEMTDTNAISRYYIQIGMGETPYDAFESVFELTPEEFYSLE